MERYRSLAAVLGASLLGVVAVAAFVTGVFTLFGAWAVREQIGGAFGDVGATGGAIVGILSIAFGVLATVAARETWLARPRGRAIGLVVAIVAFLVAVVVLLGGRVDGQEPLFYVLAVLGLVTTLPLLVDPGHESATTT